MKGLLRKCRTASDDVAITARSGVRYSGKSGLPDQSILVVAVGSGHPWPSARIYRLRSLGPSRYGSKSSGSSRHFRRLLTYLLPTSRYVKLLPRHHTIFVGHG